MGLNRLNRQKKNDFWAFWGHGYRLNDKIISAKWAKSGPSRCFVYFFYFFAFFSCILFLNAYNVYSQGQRVAPCEARKP